MPDNLSKEIIMRNRAKCKLCESIIESIHRHDYVTCKCGEISIDGGQDYCHCRATDWSNFLRIDDKGNEIVPKIVDQSEAKASQEGLSIEQQEQDTKGLSPSKPSRKDLLNMLRELIKTYESLPPVAMSTAINHYDMLSLLLLLSSILDED